MHKKEHDLDCNFFPAVYSNNYAYFLMWYTGCFEVNKPLMIGSLHLMTVKFFLIGWYYSLFIGWSEITLHMESVLYYIGLLGSCFMREKGLYMNLIVNILSLSLSKNIHRRKMRRTRTDFLIDRFFNFEHWTNNITISVRISRMRNSHYLYVD